METVAIDDLESDPRREDVDRRELTDPLGTTDVAMNHYAIDPGEGFSGSVHAHFDQEEVFLILEGTATFEIDGEEEAVTVEAGEAIRFGPGEFQCGRNRGDERVVALALGAPRDSDAVGIARVLGYGDVSCAECGHDHLRIARERGAELVCPECRWETDLDVEE